VPRLHIANGFRSLERHEKEIQAEYFCYFSITYMESFADRPARNAGRAVAAKLERQRRSLDIAEHSFGTDYRSGQTLLLRALTPVEDARTMPADDRVAL